MGDNKTSHACVENSQNSSPLNLIYDLAALQINLAYTGLHIFLWLFFMFDINVGLIFVLFFYSWMWTICQVYSDCSSASMKSAGELTHACPLFSSLTQTSYKSLVLTYIYYNMSVYHILVLILVVDINLYHILSTGTFLMIRLVYKGNPQFLSLASAIRI